MEKPSSREPTSSGCPEKWQAPSPTGSDPFFSNPQRTWYTGSCRPEAGAGLVASKLQQSEVAKYKIMALEDHGDI